MRVFSGYVSSDIHLQQSYTLANVAWLVIEWVTEGPVLYPYSHEDSDLTGEQIEVASTSLQNSTGCSCLIFKILGHAAQMILWVLSDLQVLHLE